ncbi:hypothetical protein LIA77_02680 [Sarocladium implicatum]|nr:hypothetical protein LIA77_02680 [Sarocladium implicatum]
MMVLSISCEPFSNTLYGVTADLGSQSLAVRQPREALSNHGRLELNLVARSVSSHRAFNDLAKQRALLHALRSSFYHPSNLVPSRRLPGVRPYSYMACTAAPPPALSFSWPSHRRWVSFRNFATASASRAGSGGGMVVSNALVLLQYPKSSTPPRHPQLCWH